MGAAFTLRMRLAPDFSSTTETLTPATLRAEIEVSIERLFAMLDMMDGDPDIEANGDEFEPDEDRESDLGWSVDASCAGAFPINRHRGFRTYRNEFDFVGTRVEEQS